MMNNFLQHFALDSQRTKGVAHRTDISAVDKLASITITAAENTDTSTLTNADHNICVAPGNKYGSAGVSAIVTVKPTVSKGISITIPKCDGAEWYSIYLSTDAAPKFLCRITEAERASGVKITAVGTTAAGGAAGVVSATLVGTGLASNAAPANLNNAFTPDSIAEINTDGKTKAHICVKISVTDFRSLPTVSIVPFICNRISKEYHQQAAIDLAPGSAANKGMMWETDMDVHGAFAIKFLVGSIAGQGTKVTVEVELS